MPNARIRTGGTIRRRIAKNPRFREGDEELLESGESSLGVGLDEVLLSVVRMEERGILEIRWSNRLRDYKAIGIKVYIKWGGVDNMKVEKSMDSRICFAMSHGADFITTAGIRHQYNRDPLCEK